MKELLGELEQKNEKNIVLCIENRELNIKIENIAMSFKGQVEDTNKLFSWCRKLEEELTENAIKMKVVEENVAVALNLKEVVQFFANSAHPK